MWTVINLGSDFNGLDSLEKPFQFFRGNDS